MGVVNFILEVRAAVSWSSGMQKFCLISVLKFLFKDSKSVQHFHHGKKQIEEKLETVDQEISGIRAELHGLPSIREDISSLAKSIERQGVQAEQPQQQQTFMKYIEAMIKGKTTTEEVPEGLSSKIHCMVKKDAPRGREMILQGGEILKLTKSKKMTVSIISFDGSALDWYRSHEDCNPFVNWEDLKRRLLVRFRSGREGSILGRFLTIKQETTVEKYRNLFDKLVAPLPFLQKVVIEETFMNGLKPWIKADLECWEPVGLAQMMNSSQKIEN
ncbi:transposon Tf2-1 polyprotein isoform X1 [Cucumis melo var. makuwa]|uniref:Transposon Tf2-1 polyprotein isoform X1 n=1 Tax=Cucumis melo var. makuwa TaxID=1194695 RepID=A0A5D3BZC0_CUCMM|nr:transposon Tf2-1 polyprotein isoform X1 [Cucumis melo var. makuwa]